VKAFGEYSTQNSVFIYEKKWCPQRDSNSRPSDYKAILAYCTPAGLGISINALSESPFPPDCGLKQTVSTKRPSPSHKHEDHMKLERKAVSLKRRAGGQWTRSNRSAAPLQPIQPTRTAYRNNCCGEPGRCRAALQPEADTILWRRKDLSEEVLSARRKLPPSTARPSSFRPICTRVLRPACR
jgi:hypothetical protein